MSLFETDNLKTEKSDAMRKFMNSQKKFQNLFPILETVITIALILIWSWFSAAWSAPIVSGEYLRPLLNFLNRGLCVFAIVNTLIVAIFSLSRFKTPSEPDLHDQYISFASAAAAGEIAPSLGNLETYEDKQIVLIATDVFTVESSPASPKTITVENSTGEKSTVAGEKNPKNSIAKVNSVAVPAVRRVNSAREVVRGGGRDILDLGLEDRRSCYTRSRSERLDRGRWPPARRNEMEDLSCEEFRMTVETFIAAQRKTLFQEIIAEVDG